MFKSRFAIFALLLVALMALGGAVMAQDMMEGKGGRLVVADANSNTSLDPFVSSWHSWPHYAIYPTLFSRAEDMSYIGFLADTWEVSEDSKALTINLIDFATFTDGSQRLTRKRSNGIWIDMPIRTRAPRKVAI